VFVQRMVESDRSREQVVHNFSEPAHGHL